MLTLFTIPKPFRGRIEVIQRNAIQSWLQLRPVCEIILFGKDEGTCGTATEFGLRHVPGIEYNEYGTPLIFSAFAMAQRIATYPLMCYVNADIIVMSDFVQAVEGIRKRAFVLTGRRWNLDVNEPIDYDNPQWKACLRAAVMERGKLEHCAAMDYFVFPCGLCKDMPPFTVGRGGWDGWFIYWARSTGIPVIDATEALMVVHQNHDYSHLPQDKEEAYFTGTEARRNLELAGSADRFFHLWDATWLLTEQGLRPALTAAHLKRRLDTLPILYPQSGLRVKAYRLLLRLGIVLLRWLPRFHPRRMLPGIARRVRVLWADQRQGS